MHFNLSSPVSANHSFKKLPTAFDRKDSTKISNDRVIDSSYQIQAFNKMEKKAKKQEKLNYMIIQQNRGNQIEANKIRR